MLEWLKKLFKTESKSLPSHPYFDDIGLPVRDQIFSYLGLKDVKALAQCDKQLNTFFKNQDREYSVTFKGSKEEKCTYSEIIDRFQQHHKKLEAVENSCWKPTNHIISQTTQCYEAVMGTQEDINEDTTKCQLTVFSGCGCGIGTCGGTIAGGVAGKTVSDAFIWGLVGLAGGSVAGIFSLFCCAAVYQWALLPLDECTEHQLKQNEKEAKEIQNEAPKIMKMGF